MEDYMLREQMEEHRGDPAYHPRGDVISMPDIREFTSSEHYYSAYFHEMTHSTGSPKRLDRFLTTEFGSERYSKEELVAEMGASFLCAKCRVGDISTDQDHKSYIRLWLEKIKGDNKLIYEAATKARKASEYILNKDKKL